MDARSINKSRLPSWHVTEGSQCAPRRSYCLATGASGTILNFSNAVGSTCNGALISAKGAAAVVCFADQ